MGIVAITGGANLGSSNVIDGTQGSGGGITATASTKKDGNLIFGQ
jgi:hypothetical protein